VVPHGPRRRPRLPSPLPPPNLPAFSFPRPPLSVHRFFEQLFPEEPGASRLEARLACLPRDELIRLAALGMRESPKCYEVADNRMSTLNPLPEWAVSGVLCSELLGVVLGPIARSSLRLGRVCRYWHQTLRDLCRDQLFYLRAVGEFGCAMHVTALPFLPLCDARVMVPDYGHHYLTTFSGAGKQLHPHQDAPLFGEMGRVRTPSAIAFVGSSGTAWMVEQEERTLVKILLSMGLKEPCTWSEATVERLLVIEGDEENGCEFPIDVAVAGDDLFVLNELSSTRSCLITVLDASTGAVRRQFGNNGVGTAELLGPHSLAVHGDILYVTDCLNHRLQCFSPATGAHIRSIGISAPPPRALAVDLEVHSVSYVLTRASAYAATDKRSGTAPGAFNEPVGVAVGHGHLYVSERKGRRIQVLTLEGEPLDVFYSPDGQELGGLCVERDRIWCIGPFDGRNKVHILKCLL
jgi:uncharacterized protein YaaQ